VDCRWNRDYCWCHNVPQFTGPIKAQLPGFEAHQNGLDNCGHHKKGHQIKADIKAKVNAANKLTPQDDLPIHTQINTKAKLIQYYGIFIPKAIRPK